MPLQESLIDQCQLISGLPAATRSFIAKHSNSLSVAKDSQVFDEGDSSQALALVVSGSIRVFKRSPNGREVTLYRANKENLCIVTLSCLLGNDAYPVTGVTEADTQLIIIPKPTFLELVSHEDSFRSNTFNQISVFNK